MFNFFNRKTINKKNNPLCHVSTRDNSCNVTYCQLLDNLNRSIIIHDDFDKIPKTPISSLDFNIPSHYKIYEILNDLDNVYYKHKKIYDKNSDEYDEYDIQKEKSSIIQNDVKSENIKLFISCFDKD